MAFYIVYIREAHAVDSSWPMLHDNKAGETQFIEDPIDEIERAKVAGACVADLGLPMPALVDSIDDAVNSSYRGWPDRLFLIDAEGKVAYSGGRGPFFFAPDGLEQSIRRVLGLQD